MIKMLYSSLLLSIVILAAASSCCSLNLPRSLYAYQSLIALLLQDSTETIAKKKKTKKQKRLRTKDAKRYSWVWQHFTEEGCPAGSVKCTLPGCGKFLKRDHMSSTKPVIAHLKSFAHQA